MMERNSTFSIFLQLFYFQEQRLSRGQQSIIFVVLNDSRGILRADHSIGSQEIYNCNFNFCNGKSLCDASAWPHSEIQQILEVSLNVELIWIWIELGVHLDGLNWNC